MAHLEVKKKKPYPWWIWALLLIIILAVTIIVFNIYVDGDVPNPSAANSTVNGESSNLLTYGS